MAQVAVAGAYKGAQYGAAELKTVYQKYWLIAFGIAVAIHLLMIGSYYLVELLSAEEAPTVSVRIMKYSDLGPPPSITSANTPPPISVSAPTAKPTVGAPVPVPDAEVSAEQTIATQTEMSQVAPIGDATGSGAGATGWAGATGGAGATGTTTGTISEDAVTDVDVSATALAAARRVARVALVAAVAAMAALTAATAAAAAAEAAATAASVLGSPPAAPIFDSAAT